MHGVATPVSGSTALLLRLLQVRLHRAPRLAMLLYQKLEQVGGDRPGSGAPRLEVERARLLQPGAAAMDEKNIEYVMVSRPSHRLVFLTDAFTSKGLAGVKKLVECAAHPASPTPHPPSLQDRRSLGRWVFARSHPSSVVRSWVVWSKVDGQRSTSKAVDL